MKKGALVKLVSGMDNPVPAVVLFQFNPETMQHRWSQPAGAGAPERGGPTGSSPLAVSGAPGESFSFTLSMDVTDQLTIVDEVARLAVERDGLYGRLAALELLLHPNPVTELLPSSLSARTTPAAQLPTVLFVWGKTRILPVRVISLSITEKLYDADLNPIHADAQLELRVLTSDDLRSVTGATGALADTAYKYSASKRLELAATSLRTGARDILDMIPQKPPVP